jgi:hypothetical protein
MQYIDCSHIYMPKEGRKSSSCYSSAVFIREMDGMQNTMYCAVAALAA